MVPVLYSPNEPEHFLGFFTFYLYADPDPKHCKFFSGHCQFQIYPYSGSNIEFTLLGP